MKRLITLHSSLQTALGILLRKAFGENFFHSYIAFGLTTRIQEHPGTSHLLRRLISNGCDDFGVLISEVLILAAEFARNNIPNYDDLMWQILEEDSRARIRQFCGLLREIDLSSNGLSSFRSDGITLDQHYLKLIHKCLHSMHHPNLGASSCCFVVLCLCELGMDPCGIINEEGMQPLHSLFRYESTPELSEGMVEIGTLLLEYGAYPVAITRAGNSVLDWALTTGWEMEYWKVLERCDIIVLEKIRSRLQFHQDVANSTAIDKDDQPTEASLSRRMKNLGDRLNET